MKFKFKIPRQVFILGMISFFTDFASEMLYPVAPVFLTSVLGASMVTVGAIEGAAEVIANILKGYFGALSDKLQKRALFVKIGYTLSAIVKPLPGFFPNVGVVATSRALDRVGKGIRTSPRDALLAAEATDADRGAIFGFHRSMDTFGAVAGPLFALLVLALTNDNYRAVFYFAALPSLGAIYFAFKAKEKYVPRSSVKKYEFRNALKSAPKSLRRLLFLVGIFSLVNGSDVFLILKLKEIASSDTLAIAGYVYFNAVYAVFSYPAGILSDRTSKRTVFTAGLFIFSAVYFLFAFGKSIMILSIAFTLYGFYSAATDGVLKAWISDLIKDEYRATVIGTFNFITGFGMMFASIITGVLWDNFGPAIPFAITAVISLLLAFVFLLSEKNHTEIGSK